VFQGSRAACYPALVAIYRSLDEGDDEGRDVENGEGQIARPALCANTAIRHDIALLPKYSIDSLADAGLYPMEVKGDIEFRNVTFAYPARPDVNALTGFSLKIPAGQTVALGTSL
jgi:ABC-type multidrug transport system fused ATPase/permease subunit